MNTFKRSPRAVLIITVLVFSAMVFVDHRIAWQWIYTHWLFDYHFGFMKRSLIGELLALAFGSGHVVPLETVRILSWIILIANTALFANFLLTHAKSLRNQAEKSPNLVLFACFFLLAPVGLRNFAYDLGRFDQVSFLLLLTQWFNPPVFLTAVAAAIMVLVHENFIFILLPAILLVVYSRKGWVASLGVASLAGFATLAVVFAGKPGAPIEQLWAYIQSKANSPLDYNLRLLYWNLHDQLEVNKGIYADNLKYLPGFFFCFLWCLPLIAFYRKLETKSATDKLAWLGVFVGYVGIFMLSDWARSISDLFLVLSFLILYFAKTSPELQQQILNPSSRMRKALIALILVSLVVPAGGVDIPRVYKFKELVVRYFHTL